MRQAHPDQTVDRVFQKIGEHLNEIAVLFKPGTKLTLIARAPSHPDGSCDMISTTDTLEEAIKALQTRLTAPTIRSET